MKPTLCPSRLKELISLANLERDSETRRHLKKIADAFRAKRKGQKQPTLSVEIEKRITIYINVADGKITATLGDLAAALEQLHDAGSDIDRIRECPICSEIFWAGRSDKEACARHAARWRKQEQRRREKERVAKRAISRTKRIERQVEKPLRVSRTTGAIIRAVKNQLRRWKSIDDYCYGELRKERSKYRETPPGVYRTATVKRCLKMLVDLGFLTCNEPNVKNPYYGPTGKIDRYLREGLFIFQKTDEPPTH